MTDYNEDVPLLLTLENKYNVVFPNPQEEPKEKSWASTK